MQSSQNLDTSRSTTNGLEQACWDHVSDEELLEICQKSRSMDVMAVLVRRHAPLVASVVSRVLRHTDQREEAFQATFLILMESFRKIRKSASLPSYLYGVAFRVSKRIRQKSWSDARRSNHPTDSIASMESEEANPFEALSLRLQTAVLDEELQLLPESIRAPLVEHFMVGKTVPQVAESLRLSVSAAEGRIKRGKQILRSRLARRGVSLTVVLVTIQMSNATMAASAMEALSQSTINLCHQAHSSDSMLHDVETTKSSLQELVKGETRMHSLTKPSWLIWTGTICLMSIFGLGLLSISIGGAPTQEITALSAAQAEPTPTVLFQPGQQLPAGQGAETKTDKTTESVPPTQSKAEVVKWETAGERPAWLKGQTENDGEQLIRNKLRSRGEFPQLKGVPLSEVVQILSKNWEIDVVLDDRALSDANISVDELVTIRRNSPIKYKDFLRQILDPLELSYVIRYDAIVITTKDGSKCDVVRFYDLSFVLPDNELIMELVSAIETHVTPDTWESNSGTSSMSVLGSMLIVRAPEETHDELEDFLPKAAKQSPVNMKPQPSRPFVPGGMGGGMGGMGGGGMGGMM